MSLTHQFLITLTLPAAFVVLLLYDLRLGSSRQYGPYWSLTLFVAALWASSSLSYYGGVALPAEVAVSWRIGARHLLTALAFFVLLTTTAHLETPRAIRRLLLVIAALFWVASLLLDPAIWPYRISAWSGGAPQTTHFSLWSSVWVTAWLIPMLAAMLLTRQTIGDALSALYRNRLNYWLATVVLFTIGGALALVQGPGQPAWQELGALGIVLAAVLGTATLVRSRLPNLRLALRHIVARLAASLLILALTWLFFFLFVNSMPSQGRASTVLELGLAALIFTALFSAVNRYIPWFIRRLLLPAGRNRSGALADQPALTTALPDPAALGEILLRLAQYNIAAESARLLQVEEEENGNMWLHPLAKVGQSDDREPVEFVVSRAVASRLRRRPLAPISMYELETLPAFSDVSTEEKELLQQANSEILMPLGAGDELVGLLTLGAKFTGESYDHADLAWLQDIGAHGGLLLWQAKELHQNRAQLETVRGELQQLQRKTHRLGELLALHERFAHLITPALRQPFGDIHHAVEALQKHDAANGATVPIKNLNQQLAQLRLMLNNLIVSAARIRRQHDITFTQVDMAEIVEEVVRDLQAMASARRVTVNIKAGAHLPTVVGDAQRLYEAVQHLLHNAIRFNKIGGCVDVEYGASDEQLYLHVRDDGVGISDEGLAQIWQGTAMIPGEQHSSIRSGLGLVLTRFIVRAHGGRIEASSALGTGSTFSFYLPLPASESIAAAVA